MILYIFLGVLWYLFGVIPAYFYVHKRNDISLLDLIILLIVIGALGPIAGVATLPLHKIIIPRAKQKDNKKPAPSVY